jgi:hypothetical protein
MSKRSSKSEALPTLGIAVVSLALASGASASTGEATTNIPSTCHEIFLGEEENLPTLAWRRSMSSTKKTLDHPRSPNS